MNKNNGAERHNIRRDGNFLLFFYDTSFDSVPKDFGG